MISRSVFALTLLAIVLAAGWWMRFDMRAVGGAGGVYILDRWTGEVRHCLNELCDLTVDTKATPGSSRNVFDRFDNSGG
ncbi:hypothetical protein [Stappia indica]|uniref:hypothetical protein n=1 Tax=Stappia indica TaxID=538381 RepID=UPI0014959839|nr:hypothetical protein [Stappia indica]